METWYLTGKNRDDYSFSQESGSVGNERAHTTLHAEDVKPDMYGALARVANVDVYRGKRLQFSADVKTEHVEGWAGLWMRVDREPNKDMIAIDNMHNRPITGTMEWQPHTVVLDVPDEAKLIVYGLLLSGSGRASISEVQLSEVGQDVPVTAEPMQK